MKHEETEDLDQDDHIQYIHRNPTNNARNIIQAGHYEVVPVTIKGALGHHEHLINYQDFYGKTLGYVDNDASIHCPSLSTSSVSSDKIETENLKAWSADLNKLYSEQIKAESLNGRNIDKEYEKNHTHQNDKGIHFTEQSIDHRNIQGVGSKSHDEIDGHIGESSIHFKQDDIHHKNIQGVGAHTHADIDQHIYNQDLHYPQSDIDHSKLQNLQKDHHPQYLLANGSRQAKSLNIQTNLRSQNIESNNLKTHTSHSDALTAKVAGVDELSVTDKLKVQGGSVLGSLKADCIDTDAILTKGLEIKGDLNLTGKIDGVYITQLKQDLEDHLSLKSKKDRHKCFSVRRPGFAPSTAGKQDDDTVLVSSGKWVPLRVYLELVGKDIICDADTNWKTSRNRIQIPYTGTYEVHLHNFCAIKHNGKDVLKSKNLGSHTFLMKLQQGDTIEALETSEVGSIYIKLLNYG